MHEAKARAITSRLLSIYRALDYTETSTTLQSGLALGNTFYLFGYDDNESEQLLPADAVGLG